MPSEQPETAPGEAGSAPARVRSIRVPDSLWEAINEDAVGRGMTRTSYVLARLGPPSFSEALHTLTDALDPDQLDLTAGLAADAKLAGWDRAGLRALSAGLAALAKRWPR